MPVRSVDCGCTLKVEQSPSTVTRATLRIRLEDRAKGIGNNALRSAIGKTAYTKLACTDQLVCGHCHARVPRKHWVESANATGPKRTTESELAREGRR